MPLNLFRPEDGPSETVLTVADILDAYQRHCAAESVHGPQARADRQFTFTLFRAATGHIAVADCRPFHVVDFIEAHPEWKSVDFIEAHPEWKSVSTRRAKANAIRAAFNWAFEGERIERNPFRSVRYAEAERRPELPDEVLEVVSRLANKPYERAMRFLRLTGCRLTELCQATWADVDLDRGIWTIPRHKSRRYTGKPKVVALVSGAVELLRAISGASAIVNAIESRIVAVMPVAVVSADAKPIFLNTRGTAWTRRTLGQQLARMKRRYGIKTAASLHGVRHRAASAMVVAGAPLTLVAAQLGHSTPNVTSRYYVHLDGQIDAIRAAVQLGVPK